MSFNSPKLIIGFITYGKSTAKYLPYFLPSLITENTEYIESLEILVVDNSEEQENENVKFIKKNYPQIEIEWVGGNIGFARAYNKMINQAMGAKTEYFLAINPDVILETDAIAKMIQAMDKDSELGSVCPKILRWDFKNNKKTNIIDSCGIQLKPGLQFIDLGQGQVDQGQFDNIDILGPSGAAAMYRMSALEKVKQADQYFDELMFMYKEDCDLAYRLFLSGYKSKCVAEAVVYHDRTAAGKGESNLQIALNRKNKGRQAKKWSFLNQQIIFIKYWQLQNWQNKLAIIWQEIKMFIFILLFEQYLLGQFWELRKSYNRIKKKI